MSTPVYLASIISSTFQNFIPLQIHPQHKHMSLSFAHSLCLSLTRRLYFSAPLSFRQNRFSHFEQSINGFANFVSLGTPFNDVPSHTMPLSLYIEIALEFRNRLKRPRNKTTTWQSEMPSQIKLKYDVFIHNNAFARKFIQCMCERASAHLAQNTFLFFSFYF